jgi:shikimate kinase
MSWLLGLGTMRVFLVGFMGAGKTTVGRALARALPALFWDLDARLEASFRMSVAEVFRTAGEPAFRVEESVQLQRVSAAPSAVIATGGGTFVSAENRDTIGTAGISVFLDVPWEEIVRRLPGKRCERPLFASLEGAFELFSYRVPFYRLANLVVRPEPDEGPDAVADRIAALVRVRR